MKKRGFTLIELLIVVAIVAILAGVVLIAVNPARQMAQARDAERAAEANAILSAINQFQIDKGALPDCIDTTAKWIGTTSGAGYCDLSASDLIAGNVATDDAIIEGYIAAMPEDSVGCTDCGGRGRPENTCYKVARTATNRVNVSAPCREGTTDISFTR